MNESMGAAESFSETTRKLENPFPHFAEATEAASRIYQIEKEYLKLTAELRARREGGRAALLVGALILANLAITLGLFWGTMALHEAGWSSGLLACLDLLVLGAGAGICALLGVKKK